MDRLKFTSIAHANHLFYSPLSAAKISQFINLMSLNSGEKVLDVGCGRAEVLIQICEKYQAQGVGVDINPEFIRLAQETAAKRLKENQLILHEKPVEEAQLEAESFNAAICMGSHHAFGDFRDSIQALSRLVKPGSYILLGEGYWKQKPDEAYLEFLGATRDDHVSYARNIEIAEELGLVALYSASSNQDEWDEYEGLYTRAVELYCYRHPEDPDTPAIRERIRNWRKAYQKWGRDTLGFGLYLFLRP